MKRNEEETNLQYVERILGALMKNLEIQGVTIAIKTNSGTDIFTSIGKGPHFKVLDQSEWEEFWG